MASPSAGRVRDATGVVTARAGLPGVGIGEWRRLIIRRGLRGTKTDKADRVLPLPSTLVTRLRRRAEQRGREGLVFASPRLHDKTKPRDRRNVIRHLRVRLDAAGVPWATSHTFRRTVATFMDEAAYPLAEIANQLGHANVNVTATYLGRRQGSSRAAEVLD